MRNRLRPVAAMQSQRLVAPYWLMPLALALVVPTKALGLETSLYLPADSVDAAALVELPPKLGSAELREQMAVVLWLRRTRTPAQVAFAQETLDLERFAPLLGDALLEAEAV